MARTWVTILFLISQLTGVTSSLAQAQTDEGVFNKLLAPGPLIKGHQNLEHGSCLKCHDAGKGVPDRNCLSCHTDIDRSIRTGTSFHAKVKGTCISCHTDHKGRNFDSTKVNQKTFNHSQTGFRLTGKHARIACTQCHTEKKNGDTRFFGTNNSCISCHKTDDVHHFKGKFATTECSSCHTSFDTWKRTNFDHKARTGYALVGNHARLPCASCHVPKGKASARYDFPELRNRQCLTCHDDFHKGKLGPKFSGGACDQCHTQTSWKGAHFDHARTGFPLRGGHAKLACAQCHGGKRNIPTKHLNFSGLSINCSSCHQDFHGFRNERADRLNVTLNQCQTCHSDNRWKPAHTFNHSTHTAFPLTGKHVGVQCFDCHKTQAGNRKAGRRNEARRYNFPELASKTCETCHTSPHPKDPRSVFRTQKCTTCHTTAGWKVLASATGGFDHNRMTAFPLTGHHTRLSCKSCHLKGGKEVYKFANADKQFCVSCHASVHKGQFHDNLTNAACSTCHNTTEFKTVQFNHNQARFHLTGAHAKLSQKCEACHIPTKKALASKPPRPARKFIFGKEDTGFCGECHRDVHASIKPPQFSGRFPTKDCRACHNVTSFASLLDFDHTKTRFPIVGAHAKFSKKCDECHVPTKQVLPTKPPRPAGKFRFAGADRGFCESCHGEVHKQQFSKEFREKQCTECHTQVSFKRRLPFDHNTTKFKITGAHQKFRNDCVKCHTPTKHLLPTQPPKAAGQFQFGWASRGFCEACHTNEHKGQFRKQIATSPCRDCHNTVAFEKNIKFNHSRARFDIHGKHKQVKCEQCHVDTKARYAEPPHHFKGRYRWAKLFERDCALCHEDPHKGQFGTQCSNCHTEAGWSRTASFHKDNVLGGVHNMIACAECHTDGRVLTGMGDDCKVCHQKDDPHLGTQPQCSECHNQLFWSTTNFHHSSTNFPLRGMHRTLPCSDCHMGGVYQGLNHECSVCHFEDARQVPSPDHSLPGFEQCETCHNQFSFSGANR